MSLMLYTHVIFIGHTQFLVRTRIAYYHRRTHMCGPFTQCLGNTFAFPAVQVLDARTHYFLSYSEIFATLRPLVSLSLPFRRRVIPFTKTYPITPDNPVRALPVIITHDALWYRSIGLRYIYIYINNRAERTRFCQWRRRDGRTKKTRNLIVTRT